MKKNLTYFKNKDRYAIENYKPLSSVPNRAKIKNMFILVLKSIKKFIILSTKWFGFMKKMGTWDAIIIMTSIIYEKLNKINPGAITFIDLAEAFDDKPLDVC